MILVENLAIHLNNEPHRPRNGDLCSSTLQRWLGALDTGIPNKEIRFLAPIVMCQMVTHTPAILEQARENWEKGLFRYDPPVVANKWVRYYDLPGSKEDVHAKCAKEWFHPKCVHLARIPPPRSKWYCPECRVKLGKGVFSDGVVGGNNIR
ncbi:hypothetical protein D6C86_02105 [Aureobasidium pullulans]|nr:hypothetical protein D6C86_02105 [Aureobasidium pullulans]